MAALTCISVSRLRYWPIRLSAFIAAVSFAACWPAAGLPPSAAPTSASATAALVRYLIFVSLLARVVSPLRSTGPVGDCIQARWSRSGAIGSSCPPVPGGERMEVGAEGDHGSSLAARPSKRSATSQEGQREEGEERPRQAAAPGE